MKRLLSIHILFFYLLVGFGVPLDGRGCTHHETEVAKKKKPPLQRNFRLHHLWSTVKHIVSQNPDTKPDQNHLIPAEVKAAYHSSENLLGPAEDFLTSPKSPLFRELRAPPQL